MVWFPRISGAAAVLAFVVITLGAWVRLTDAGLGCPDWPGCFGHLLVPESEQALARVANEFDGAVVETGKAWREMIHRYVASTLGLMILALAVMGWRNRHDPRQPVLIPFALVGLVLFQGLLGMWTVTLLLQPVIVMGHLLGGMTILTLLTWLALTTGRGVRRRRARTGVERLALAALLFTFAQIGLGGWTSTNYAALACPDFPTCQLQWWPEADWAEGFVPWRAIEDHGVADFEGGVLMHPARVAIHLTHRIGAIVLTLVLLLAAWRAATRLGPPGRAAASLSLAFLTLQIGIGVAIVKFGLPLWLGVAHNGNAALLLLSVLTLGVVARYETAAVRRDSRIPLAESHVVGHVQ
ncbi:MAG: COX15/CtaA family protein [Pseudomonadota bacterium]